MAGARAPPLALTFAALIGVLVLAVGWRWGGLGRRGLLPLAAALTLGAAGYSLTGRPDLPSSPSGATNEADPFIADRLALRNRLIGRTDPSDRRWLIYADGLARAGERRASADVLISATRTLPESAALQTALGFALIDYADGTVTPAAALAIERARILAPDAPASAFLEGEAAARLRDYDRAAQLWTALLNRSAGGAVWRSDVLVRLALLQRLAEAQARQGGAP